MAYMTSGVHTHLCILLNPLVSVAMPLVYLVSVYPTDLEAVNLYFHQEMLGSVYKTAVVAKGICEFYLELPLKNTQNSKYIIMTPLKASMTIIMTAKKLQQHKMTCQTFPTARSREWTWYLQTAHSIKCCGKKQKEGKLQL